MCVYRMELSSRTEFEELDFDVKSNIVSEVCEGWHLNCLHGAFWSLSVIGVSSPHQAHVSLPTPGRGVLGRIWSLTLGLLADTQGTGHRSFPERSPLVGRPSVRSGWGVLKGTEH